jgi:putative transposase
VNVYPFIEAERAQQRNVKRACELLEVSRAAYYAHHGGAVPARQPTDEELTEHIRQAHQASRAATAPPHPRRTASSRAPPWPQACGTPDARRRAVWPHPAPFKRTTVPDPAAAARADLIRRDFAVNAAAVNTRWCGDITYVPTWEGWLYLATVIDIASRRVVGFALAEHLRAELVADTLTNAVAARDPAPGVVFHSDKGCQYVSGDYATLADDLEVTLSTGRTGQCWTTPSPNRSSPR